MFFWILELLRDEGLVKGKTVGINGTTLEANAATRWIVPRDTISGVAFLWSAHKHQELYSGLCFLLDVI